ncbi:hypothetical protein GA0061099_10273 [Bradyrhizobium yuanmingense]|uniref:Uncharacterized protein n=1 Tax=Bradyrhizobium yuanmingense TaxID=108015 RepID=A0A1C3XJF5_9BRAD|nr:hypothetical protein IQ15_07310 [Bradyrhizobium yuanmingense]SCB52104.1 hypothetical protein GA0061099_10273 [Bradyrhizobium yuanmingense]
MHTVQPVEMHLAIGLEVHFAKQLRQFQKALGENKQQHLSLLAGHPVFFEGVDRPPTQPFIF